MAQWKHWQSEDERHGVLAAFCTRASGTYIGRRMRKEPKASEKLNNY